MEVDNIQRTDSKLNVRLKVRRATFGDYQSVLDIDRTVFDGLDYVSAMFYPFLHSGQHVVYVVEDAGKVIAFFSYRFHDANTVINMSLRLAKSYRGQGLFSQGWRQFETVFRRLYPQVTHEITVSSLNHIDKGEWTVLSRSNVIIYKFAVSFLRDSLTRWRTNCTDRQQVVRDVSYDRVVQLLQSTDLLEDFLRRYARDFVLGQSNNRPMSIDKTGLRELFASSSKIMMTTVLADEASDDVTQLPDCIKSITSVSYSCPFQADIGVSGRIFVFADDPCLIGEHVHGHLRHLANVSNGNVGLRLTFPFDVDSGDVKDILQGLLGEPAEFGAVIATAVRCVTPSSKL